MGLDNFWVKPGSDDPTGVDVGFGLCGGLFSGDGGSSFRGKVYENDVASITGESLYQERIDAETVRRMADDLERAAESHQGDSSISRLARMFRAHADAGHELVGWW